MAKEIEIEHEDGTTEKVTAYFLKDKVKVKIAYPKDYAKTKHFKDDDIVELHELTAAAFIKKGIASIVKDK